MLHPSPRSDGTELRERFGAHSFVLWSDLTDPSTADSDPVLFGSLDAPTDDDDRPDGSVCVRLDGVRGWLYQKQDGVYKALGVYDGVVPAARLAMPNQPANTNTIGIGADTYEFSDDGTVTAGRIKVDIGGSAAATLTNLITAINASGTEPIKASAVGTYLLIQYADDAGGNPVAGAPSIALAEAITDAADVWEGGFANLNEVPGEVAVPKRRANAKVTASAGLVAASACLLAQFEFTPTDFFVQVRSSAGVIKVLSDAFTISGKGILWTQAGGTHLSATDIVSIEAWE